MQTISHKLQIAQEHAGNRVDQAAGELLPDYSRARLQKWIRNGALTIDGRRVKPSQRLSGGEWLVLSAELAVEGEVLPEPIPIDVVFEDEDLLVVNKPAGLVVHPAAGHPNGTLQNALLHHRPELEALPRAGIVHRLDKDTTGVMVVAASLRAHTTLVQQLQARSMSRIYECIARGRLSGPGTVDAPIGRHPRDRIRMAVVPGGKPAVTHYRVLAAFENYTHLEVSLESGRTHQIRVHLQHLEHPLAADPLYGGKGNRADRDGEELTEALSQLARQALHARTLRLKHPGHDEAMAFSAPIPDDLKGVLSVLKKQAEAGADSDE